MNRLKQCKAFTIVEMIIVIAVIAILAAVLIPTVSTVIQKANISADTQFAASLNIRLAMWEIDNGSIENESELRDAVNYYYGEYDADGNITSDFYATLAPKSGKYGYHYWYDIENCRVVTCTYEMIADLDEDASAAAEENTFSGAGIRLLSVNGKSYLLMDRAGSELADCLSALENSAEVSDYVDAADEFQNSEDPLYKAINEKLAYTAVVNEKGMFTTGNEVSAIYISLYAGVLGADTYINGSAVGRSDITYNFDAGYVINIPSGVVIGSGSLNGLPITTYNAETNAYMIGSTEIHIDITVEELGTTFGAGATNAVIVIANDDRYVQEGVKFYKLPDMAIVEGVTSEGSDISVDDKTFEIADNANTGEKFGLEFTVGTANTISLDTLFSAKEGKDIGTVTVEYHLNDGSGQPCKAAEMVTSYWGDHQIDLSDTAEGQSIIITLNNDGEKTQLRVRIKNGAYNVVDRSDWVDAGDSIVLLSDIKLEDYFDDNDKTITYLNGNYHTIDATELKKKGVANDPNHLIGIFSAGSTMEYIVINGPEYAKVNTTLSTGVFPTLGVRIANSSIKNSYISGFFYPVGVTGGAVSIENSVLYGGCNQSEGSDANIYSNTSKETTIKLDNVTTIHNKGIGVFLDIGMTSNAIVEITGDTYHYNWCSVDSTEEVISTVVGSIGQEYSHEINGTKYVNMGIVQKLSIDNEDIEVTSNTTPVHNKQSIYNSTTKATDYYLWTYRNSEEYTHALLPAWGSTADEFLASREVSDAN